MHGLIGLLYSPGVDRREIVANGVEAEAGEKHGSPVSFAELMQEQEVLHLLMGVLECTERHARSIYIFHVDRPGPAFLAAEGGEVLAGTFSVLPEVVADHWLAGR